MWGAFQQILCCFSFSLFSMWHCFHCGSPYRFPSVFIWYYVDGCCCVACSLLSLAVASPDALCMYAGWLLLLLLLFFHLFSFFSICVQLLLLQFGSVVRWGTRCAREHCFRSLSVNRIASERLSKCHLCTRYWYTQLSTHSASHTQHLIMEIKIELDFSCSTTTKSVRSVYQRILCERN